MEIIASFFSHPGVHFCNFGLPTIVSAHTASASEIGRAGRRADEATHALERKKKKGPPFCKQAATIEQDTTNKRGSRCFTSAGWSAQANRLTKLGYLLLLRPARPIDSLGPLIRSRYEAFRREGGELLRGVVWFEETVVFGNAIMKGWRKWARESTIVRIFPPGSRLDW
jgi:hypothetical protein